MKKCKNEGSISWVFAARVTRRKLKSKGIKSPDLSKMIPIKIDNKTIKFK